MLRPLRLGDWEAWGEVRRRCGDWLLKWEPVSPPGRPDPVRSRQAFGARCQARDREWDLGTSYGFGLFVKGRFAGEITLGPVQRGPYQNAYLGYWIDRDLAGQGYVPEAVVLVACFAFEQLNLHRLQVSIIPRNYASVRVAEKLGLRDEGVALRYLKINGIWENHVRYAITVEDWEERRAELLAEWVAPTAATAVD